jgi:hypothetical protein
MATTKQMPALQLPTTAIVDRSNVRLGSGNISAAMPPIKLPTKEIADNGTVRLGSGNVSASMLPLTA